MALDFPTTGRQSRVRMIPEEEQQPENLSELIQPREANSPPSATVYPTQVLATFSTIAKVLGARAILMVATLGAFTLAWAAMESPSMMTLATTAIYDAFIVVPLVVLTAMRN